MPHTKPRVSSELGWKGQHGSWLSQLNVNSLCSSGSDLKVVDDNNFENTIPIFLFLVQTMQYKFLAVRDTHWFVSHKNTITNHNASRNNCIQYISMRPIHSPSLDTPLLAWSPHMSGMRMYLPRSHWRLCPRATPRCPGPAPPSPRPRPASHRPAEAGPENRVRTFCPVRWYRDGTRSIYASRVKNLNKYLFLSTGYLFCFSCSSTHIYS